MSDCLYIQKSLARAFKVLCVQSGKAPATKRMSEFVRLGCDAYDFTGTWSNSYVLVHCSWPKPKDMGNFGEGWFTYLTKEDMERAFCIGSAKIRTYPLGESNQPFRRDVLSKRQLQSFLDLPGEGVASKKSFSSAQTHLVTNFLKGVGFERYTLSIGGADAPMMYEAATTDGLRCAALVMPIRG